jgi:putative transcriptional regulator
MTRHVNVALLACLLAIGCSAALAQDTGKPLLLVAAPSLQGAFQRTALVAVPVDGKHIGFILNLATDVKLSTLFPEHAASAKVADPVYIGGPEMNEALFAMLRRDPGGRALNLFDNLFVTGKADTINQIIEQTPNEARYFAGFVGWQPGELEKEIGLGIWYVTEPDPGLVFRRDTSGMWEELVSKLGKSSPAPLVGNQLRAGLLGARSLLLRTPSPSLSRSTRFGMPSPSMSPRRQLPRVMYQRPSRSAQVGWS